MKILISGYKTPSIAENIAHELELRGFIVSVFFLDDARHWIDRFILKRLNSLFKVLLRSKRDFDCFMGTRFNQERWYERRLGRLFDAFQPDLVFVIQGKPIFSVERLRGRRVKFIGWWIEPSDIESEILHNAQGFDYYYTFSINSLALLRANGVSCGYLSHGYSTAIFQPLRIEHKRFDLVFVGNWSPWRDQVLKNAFEVTRNIRIVGPRWRGRTAIEKTLFKESYGGDKINEPDLNKLYNSAKIVLNAARIEKSSGLNLRFFEVLGSGSLLLSDQAPEIDIHFRPNIDLIIFGSLSELRDSIDYFLQNDAKRREVALNGRARVIQSFTYEHLASKLAYQFESMAL
jgi:glycosyltransferase involved in cell wall biosynthesis